jgi:hypothetical protein
MSGEPATGAQPSSKPTLPMFEMWSSAIEAFGPLVELAGL